MTLVKICGITTIDDALAAVEAGADALGFNFYRRSPRYVEPRAAERILSALPAGVLKVGVFVDAVDVAVAGLDLVQLHGGRMESGRWWQAVSAHAPALAESMKSSTAEAFLVDTPAGELRGGTGKTFDWSLVAGLPARVVLAGGLDADNVVEAIQAARPWGVDACSRLECAPGRKDPRKVREFVRAARSAENL